MMETGILSIIKNFNITRKRATIILTVIIGLISIPSTLSFGILKDFTLFNKTIFDLLDYSTSNILLPFNTLLICLLSGWCIKSLWKEILGENIFGYIFNILLKFVVPIILILVLVTGL